MHIIYPLSDKMVSDKMVPDKKAPDKKAPEKKNGHLLGDNINEDKMQRRIRCY